MDRKLLGILAVLVAVVALAALGVAALVRGWERDGVAEVREAISRFERIHGRIGEGTPLTDALRSIVSVRDGLKLRRGTGGNFHNWIVTGFRETGLDIALLYGNQAVKISGGLTNEFSAMGIAESH